MAYESTGFFARDALYGASPAQAVGRFFIRYFNFLGRASVSEFWWVFGFLVLISVPISAVDQHYGVNIKPVVKGFLAMPVVSLIFRRLHDLGRTGFLCLIGFIPVFGGLALLFMMCLPTRERAAL